MIGSGLNPAAQNLAPVILTGRGGSGTRLLAELVHALGVFLGNDLNPSFDSLEWVDDVYALALETTELGEPASMERYLYWRERFIQRTDAVLGRAPAGARSLWGWKLPESILCLPQLTRVFPSARVIHLVRHPFSSSFRRTHVTSRTDNPIGRAVLTAAYRALGRDLGRIDDDEPYMHNAITWVYQVRSAVDHLSTRVEASRVLHVRYEELCESPESVQSALVSLLGLTARPHMALRGIDRTRTGEASFSVGQAEAVWTVCGETARKLGYVRGA